MASWKDKLVAGALGGLPFKTKAKQRIVGRRVAVSEYPSRDSPSTVDMGRKARAWQFTAFLIGDDYMSYRDEFVAMLESPGPHVLKDPWGGEEFLVKLQSPVTMRESSDEGGMVSFELDLVESGDEELFPSILDPGARVPGAAALALAALEGDFAFKFKGAGLLQQAANAVFKMSSKLRQIRGKIAGKLNQVENLSTAIDEFDNNIEALLLTPQAFASTFSQLIGSVLGLLRGPSPAAIAAERPGARVVVARGALKEMFGAPDLELDPVVGTTPTRERQRANQAEISRVVKVAALIEVTVAFTELPFATGDTVADTKGETAVYYDAILDDPVLTDELYTTLVELRSLLVDHLDEQSVALPQLTTTALQRGLPALVLSHRLYGDVSHEGEVVDLNHLANPAKVPAGVELTVVSNG